jgi:hypothetical protein
MLGIEAQPNRLESGFTLLDPMEWYLDQLPKMKAADSSAGSGCG